MLDGSSPRVRGKPDKRHELRVRDGLIPARAGKTQGNAGVGGGDGAHPRACGENCAGQFFYHVDKGSSPRVRGKLRPLC